MKKRVFAVFAALLFAGSTMSMASSIIEESGPTKCQQLAMHIGTAMMESGDYTWEETQAVMDGMVVLCNALME